MIISDAKIDWNPNFDNAPNLEIWVDEIPYKRVLYTQKGSCYWGEIDGYVSFYSYKSPDQGYGGREFTLSMADGSTKVLKGPWSGNAHSMAAGGFPMSYDVIMHVPGPRGMERYWGHITEERYLEAFEFCKHEGQLIATKCPAPYSSECSSEQNAVIGCVAGPNVRMIVSYEIARLGMTFAQSQAWKRVNRSRGHYVDDKNWISWLGGYDTLANLQNRRDDSAAFINALIVENGLEVHGQPLITELLPVPPLQVPPKRDYTEYGEDGNDIGESVSWRSF